MFTIKELQQLRTILTYADLPNNKFIETLDIHQDNSITIQKLRDKICDLIILKKAWNKENGIEEEQIHL